MKEKEQSTAESILSRKDYLAIAVVIAGGFVAILNQTILSPALPKLMQEFHVTTDLIQWVTTIYMLVNGIMIPVTAYLIDRFSTRKLFITSMVIFMVGTVMAVVAPSYPLLIVARVLQAMGAGIGLPLVAYIPMVMFPKEKMCIRDRDLGHVIVSITPKIRDKINSFVK